MNNSITKLLSLSFIFSAFAFTTSSAQADTKQQLLRCSDTYFSQGVYGSYFSSLYPGGGGSVCASDALTRGEISIVAGRLLNIKLKDAGPDPFILYEVYWIPVGGNPIDVNDPSGDGTRIKVGNVITDCNHQTDSYVQDLTGPVDLASPPVNIKDRIGKTKFSGHFLLYSRGTQGSTSDGSCDPSKLTKTVFSPDLWSGMTNAYEGVQFISGHELPQWSFLDNVLNFFLPPEGGALPPPPQ